MNEIDWVRLRKFHRMSGWSDRIMWGIFISFALFFGCVGVLAFQREAMRCFDKGDCHTSELVVFFGGFVVVIVALILPFLWMRLGVPFLRVLQDSPGKIVWLYLKTAAPYRVVSICAGLEDGKLLELTVCAGSSSVATPEELLVRFSALAPLATVGFSGVNEARFGQAPTSMRRGAP